MLGLFNLIELAPDQTRDADQLDTGAMSLAQCFAFTSQAGWEIQQAIEAQARPLKTLRTVFLGVGIPDMSLI